MEPGPSDIPELFGAVGGQGIYPDLLRLRERCSGDPVDRRILREGEGTVLSGVRGSTLSGVILTLKVAQIMGATKINNAEGRQ